jgi:perosamine synthetase
VLGLLPVEFWDYRFGDVVTAIISAIGQSSRQQTLSIPGLGECIAARSARAAIVTAIKALGLTPGARVGVPLYCCSVVFKAIQAGGCKPRFIDVESGTFCLSATDLNAKRSQIDAVIAVHMYGNVCDVPRLQDAAPGMPVIEDCALSLGSKLGDRTTGSLGDIAVFSSRSGKYLSVGEGGAIFSKNARVQSEAAKLISKLPVPGHVEELLHVAKTYLRSSLRSRPFYGLVGYALWEAYNKRALFSEKSPIAISQIYRTDLQLTRKRLGLLGSMIDAQRSYADYFLRNLRADSSAFCHEPAGAFYNRYQFPLTLPSQNDRDSLAAYLHRRQIDTAKPLDDIVEVARTYYGYNGDCPVAEKLSKQVLIIPSYHSVGRWEIERIARCVSDGLLELSRSSNAARSTDIDQMSKSGTTYRARSSKVSKARV